MWYCAATNRFKLAQGDETRRHLKSNFWLEESSVTLEEFNRLTLVNIHKADKILFVWSFLTQICFIKMTGERKNKKNFQIRSNQQFHVIWINKPRANFCQFQANQKLLVCDFIAVVNGEFSSALKLINLKIKSHSTRVIKCEFITWFGTSDIW